MGRFIGYTGYVGTNLLRQRLFDNLYNSKNIEDMCGESFELIVCAGIPAAKWVANNDPRSDWQNIQRLIDNLAQVTTANFILISTIDVYPLLLGVDETTDRHRPTQPSLWSASPGHGILRERAVPPPPYSPAARSLRAWPKKECHL